MGFFSDFAKQLIGKGDDEASEVIRRKLLDSGSSAAPESFVPRPNFGQAADGGAAAPPQNPTLPAPRPIINQDAAARIAPDSISPVPAPRMNVPITEEPPPIPPPKFITDMEQVSASTRLTSGKGTRVRTSDGAILGQGLELTPPRAASIPAPRPINLDPSVMGTATAPDAVSTVPPPKAFIGVPTREGMSSAERSGAKLQALQSADPKSKVRETAEGYEIDPPQKLGRLKAMGKGFLLRMLAGRQYGLGGMLGAGISGTVEGAVAPGNVQSAIRQNEIARAQGDQATAQQLERGTIANQAAQVNLDTDRDQLANLPAERTRRNAADARTQTQAELSDWEQQVARLDKVGSDDPARTSYVAALQKEAERLSQKAGRQITLIPGEGREPLRMAVDGQIVERNQDGSWKSVFGAPKTDRTEENYDEKSQYDWSVKNTENEAKRSAAQQAATVAESAAADHQKKVTTIAGQLSTLDQQMGSMSSRDPKLGPMKRQREQLKQEQVREQSAMDTAYKERDKAKADASGVPVIPPPPRRARRAASGGGQALSKSAWMSAHPGGNWAAAQQEAQRRQLPIIP